MNLSELKNMMNMNKGWATTIKSVVSSELGISHSYLQMKKTIQKGWLFISTPDGMYEEDRVHWVDSIKFFVMSGLGMTTSHPYHRKITEMLDYGRFNPNPLRMYQYTEKAEPKEMLGKDLPNNKD